jgi:hypothetical protein
VSAYVEKVGPQDYSISLIDDVEGNGSSVETLRFSLSATVSAGSEPEQDADVIKAATEELAHHGYILDTDFRGSGDRLSVVVCTSDRAMEWLENQRPPAEKFDLLLAGLRCLGPGDLTVVHTYPDHTLMGIIPELAADQPDDGHDGGDRASIVDWDDREEFLRALAAERPAAIYIERYQGGYAERIRGWGDLKHLDIRGLKPLRAEVAQCDEELSGFTAAFRGDSVHRYVTRADWAVDLEERLDALESRVIAAQEEHTKFPHLKEWGEQLYQVLINDDQFITAETSRERSDRGRDLARGMFGSSCPVESPYIRRALNKARAKRPGIIVERQQQRQRQQQAEWRAAIPTWAVQLVALPGYQQATTAERAMLASNLLYAHDPSADIPELVRLLRDAAADFLG